MRIIKLAPEKCSNHGHNFFWWFFFIFSHSSSAKTFQRNLVQNHTIAIRIFFSLLLWLVLLQEIQTNAYHVFLAYNILYYIIYSKQQVLLEKWRGKMEINNFRWVKNNGHKAIIILCSPSPIKVKQSGIHPQILCLVSLCVYITGTIALCIELGYRTTPNQIERMTSEIALS